MKVKAWVDDKGQVANWGDAVNGVMVEAISGEKPELVPAARVLEEINYMAIGSILRWVDRNSIVWGAGFLNETETCANPAKICAVRGPLTKEKLFDLNIECPEIYGDPVLLLPKFYTPKVEKKYLLGIVPHWQDQFHASYFPEGPNYNPRFWNTEEGVVIIPAQDRNTLVSKGTPRFEEENRKGIFNFIDMICSCEKIASSSLHGLACADAYGIPNIQISIFKQPQFKYNDYFLSVERDCYLPIDCTRGINVSYIMEKEFYQGKFDGDKLLSVCPFRRR